MRKTIIRSQNGKLCFVLILLGIAALLSQICMAQASLGSAKDSLERSQNIVNYMRTSGLDTGRVEDLLAEARLFLDSAQYDSVKNIEGQIQQLRDRALLLSMRLELAQTLILEAEQIGYNVSQERAALNLSHEAFSQSNYELSESILQTLHLPLQARLQSHLSTLMNISEQLAPLATDLGSDRARQVQQRIENMYSNGSLKGISELHAEIALLNSSLYQLLQVKKRIADLADKDIITQRIQDPYSEAVVALELGLYDKTLEEANRALLLCEQAESLKKSIEDAQLETDELASEGLRLEEAMVALTQANAEFAKGDFEASQKSLQNAQDQLTEAKSSSMFKEVLNKKAAATLLPFLKRNWYFFAGGSLIIALVILFSYRSIKKKFLERQIRKFHEEEKTIGDLMKKDQEQYFKQKNMSKSAYEARMDAHQEQLLIVKETLPLLEKKLQNLNK